MVYNENLFKEIDLLAKHIMDSLKDKSTIVLARSFAHYMLIVANLSFDQAKNLVEKKNAPTYIWKLFKTSSEFVKLTPRPAGINIVEATLKDVMQSCLDVKHLATLKINANKDIIMPNIQERYLYQHPKYIWIRFYSASEISFDFQKHNIDRIVLLNKTVYELYILKKNKSNISIKTFTLSDPIKKIKYSDNYFNVISCIQHIENEKGSIVFCSELNLFAENTSLFISNYIKFHFCYKTNSMIFEILTHAHGKILNLVLINALIFSNKKNLSMMNNDTHGPLLKYTGDQPTLLLSKSKRNTIYNCEGSRAHLSLDMPADHGANSNYLEVVGIVTEHNMNFIDSII